MANLKSLARKLKGAVASPVGKKIGIGLGVAAATAVAGYGIYKGVKALRGMNRTKSRSTLARVRNKRRIWQEKTKLERAKKAYEKVISQ